MNNRNHRDDQWRSNQQGGSYGSDHPDSPRQSQQYADYSGQQGSADEDYRSQWREPGDRFDAGSSNDGSRGSRERRPATSYGDVGPYQVRSGGGYRQSNYDRGAAGGYAGGAGDWRQSFAGGGPARAESHGASSSGRYGEERGMLARAGDEVMSWFGDEDARRRREADHRGRGPADYTRSDERIREDVNDRLTDDWRIDARKVSVMVENGEVTLTGTVDSRKAKRQAEDCAEEVSGVKHVQNNLRVAETGQWRSEEHTGGDTV